MANETIYGRHVIRTMQRGNEWQGRAFRGKSTVTGLHVGTDETSVITSIKDELSRHARSQLAARGDDGYPTTDEVRDAFNSLKMTKNQQDMLWAHIAAPDHVLTARQIGKAGGYSGYEAANSQYGRLGKLLADELNWVPPKGRNGQTIWTNALALSANDDQDRDESEWHWRLRPQIVEALSAQAQKPSEHRA